MSCLKNSRSEQKEFFFIDQKKITQEEYSICISKRSCRIKPSGKAFSLSAEMAFQYCRFAGKRLPSRTELEASKDILADYKSDSAEWTSDSEKDSASSGRCASSSPYLTHTPAWMIQKPMPEKTALPSSINAEQTETFHKLAELDELNKPFCKHLYTSPAHCRDPVSYVYTNESRNYLFGPYIKNLGGGYVGIAADANYTFIAHAKSEWVWLMDFDYVIVHLHKMIRAFVLESDTPAKFASFFNPAKSGAAIELLKRSHNEEEIAVMKKVLQRYGKNLYEHYQKIQLPFSESPDFGWLRNPKAYAYIRTLFQKNRISIQGGDLLKDKSLFSIGNAAKKLGVKIRVFYPSNAEEFWEFSPNYKRNISNLPFDEGSVTIRTVHEYPWQEADRKNGVAGFWHQTVHGAANWQKKLMSPKYTIIDHFKKDRIFPDDTKDFSTIDLPSNVPDSVYGLSGN